MEPTGNAGRGPDIRVYASKIKALGWTIPGLGLSVLLVYLGLFLPPGTQDSFIQDPVNRGLIVVVGIPLFGAATVRGLIRVYSAAPVLVVNHEGIRVNSRLMGVGTIPWSEIGALVEHHTPVQMVLTIKLIDSASLYAYWRCRMFCLPRQGQHAIGRG